MKTSSGKQIIDVKYNADNPNIFSCSSIDTSPFWKGVLWDAKAVKMGYQWKVVVVRKLSFGKITGFGSCSLAIQYQEVYFLVNEKIKTIVELWDGGIFESYL
jgi:hypothetical protein